MLQSFNKINKVEGELLLPGDKSISHRAVMFSAMAKGVSTIENLSNAEDVNSTISCFRQLGCEITKTENLVRVVGKGYKGFTKPTEALNAGNSGTTARLLSGILAAQDFDSTIIGDNSLSQRPMKRVIEPLSKMGAKIKSSDALTLPMTIHPPKRLHPIDFEMNVPSAQVKSAVLLAGLHGDTSTSVIEFVPTRNHTELLLDLKTISDTDKRVIFASIEDYPQNAEYVVPSDISTASFFIVLALLTKDSNLKIKNVGLNPTRTGVMEVLKLMGAKFRIENKRQVMGEMIGDLVISNGSLTNVKIPAHLIPNIIDEVPILSVAGLFAEGKFEIEGAGELRFKETDRIKAICNNMKLLGLDVEESGDGFSISGQVKNKNVTFKSYDDHRIAMAFSILSILLEGGTVEGFGCCNISNPDFLSQLNSIVR
ncbi:MAG: 3-phosphoshikimate 1-carboxyvinyltransferase [Ignavibacteriales bacterium]|nr:MAG: 3-phosphoshikimate 1-carboxyvinyltransferase [Ignavibacteriales bacterium]